MAMSSTNNYAVGWLHPLHAIGSGCDSKPLLPISIPREITDVQGLSSFATELADCHSAAQDERGKQVPVFLGKEGMEIRLDGQIGGVSQTRIPISLRFCDVAPVQARRQQLIVIGRRHGVGRIWHSKQGNPCNADWCFLDMWVLVVQVDEAVLQSILNSMSSLGAIRPDFQAVYNLTTMPIGSGSVSTVHVAKRVRHDVQSKSHAFSATSHGEIGSEVKVAAKVFFKGTLDRSTSEIACTEAALLLDAQRHPNIIGLHGIFMLPDACGSHNLRWVIAMEWCSNGDLHDHVQANGSFSEEQAVEVAVGVLAALSHIHARGIVHRDVKAENILLGENNRPLLSDFGIASRVENAERMAQRPGTPGYAAPEVLNGEKYDAKVDVFSTGVVLYFTLFRALPFSGADIAVVLLRTMRCKIRFPTKSHDHVSHHLKQFVRLLMHKEPNIRLSAQKAMRIAWSNWLRGHFEVARWLQDIKSQVKQRCPCVESGNAVGQADFEDVEEPGGNMDSKRVKDEGVSAAGANHGDLWKSKRITTVASNTDLSSAPGCKVSSTSVKGSAASDAIIEDPIVVREKAGEEMEFRKGSWMHTRPCSGNTSQTDDGRLVSITCREDVLWARESFSEISNGRRGIRDALTSPEPELIQESVAKPLRLLPKSSGMQTHAQSGSAAEAKQPTMTPTPPPGPNSACRRPTSMWRKPNEDDSQINPMFALNTSNVESRQDTRRNRCGSASSSSTPMAFAGSVTSRVQHYLFGRGSGGSDEDSRTQNGCKGVMHRGRRFFRPPAARLGGRTTTSEPSTAFDDLERSCFKEQLTDRSERASEQGRGERTYKSDDSSSVASDNSEDIFSKF